MKTWQSFDAGSEKPSCRASRILGPRLLELEKLEALEAEFAKLLGDLRTNDPKLYGVPKHSELESNHCLAARDGIVKDGVYITPKEKLILPDYPSKIPSPA